MRKYFDALASVYFKTMADGRRLFCPWGIWGSCYVIPSEQDYERRRRQIRNYIIATLVLIGATAGFQTYLAAIVVGLLLVAFYVIWVRFLLRGLKPSTEKLSMQEAVSSQAITHSPVFLWLMEIFSLLFVAAGVLILIFDPGEWLMGLSSIGFFGLCAALATYMLVLRSRSVAH
jgi:hypothetical protein